MKNSIILILMLMFSHIVNAQFKVIKENESCKDKNDGSIEIVSLGFKGPFKYKWSHSSKDTTAKISNLKPGDYIVTISYDKCDVVKAAKVQPGSELKVNIVPQLITREGGGCGIIPTSKLLLKALTSGNNGPVITTFGQNNLREVRTPVSIVVVAKDSAGCHATDHFETKEGAFLCSFDPNDIAGNIGLDSARWISKKDLLDYKIRFENDPDFATANASRVLIEVPLDDDNDPFSARITSFGFSGNIFEVPTNVNTYQTRLDLIASKGIYVDVTSGLDIANNKMIWQFETIDPETGQQPIDPLKGFLPINDTLTGSGEGFVTFTALAKIETPTGELVLEEASIIFDSNAPLLTNTWSNKIDAFAPTSTLNNIADTVINDTINLCWTSRDDIGGVGLRSYRIQYEVNGENPSNLIDDWTENCFQFVGKRGNTYSFKVLAKDLVNNEEVKLNYEQTVYINPLKEINYKSAIGLFTCPNDTLTVDAEVISIDSFDVSISYDKGQNFTYLSSIDYTQFPYKIFISLVHSGDTIVVKLKDKHSLFTSSTQGIVVRSLPSVNAGDDLSVCDNDFITLVADGANDFLWQPIANMGTPFNYLTNVYTDTSLIVSVTGVDVYGCKNTDSVYITVLPTSTDTIIVPLCQGDSIFINGAWQDTLGFYTTVYTNQYNCDSTIVRKIEWQNPCIWSGGNHVYVNVAAVGMKNGMSWINACTDLQDALYIAGRYENVQEIWVAQGTYRPSNNRRDTSFILKDSIKIYGGFQGNENIKELRSIDAALVRLSGDLGVPNNTSDNSIHVVKAFTSCVDCLLDGLTIQYGNANVNTGDENKGAGLLNEGNLNLKNVTFERNDATNSGAAILAKNPQAFMEINGCTFKLNNSPLGKDVLFSDGAIIKFLGVNMMKD